MESLKETLCGYAFVTGGPGSGTTTTAMKLVTAIVSGGVGETRQHEPKLTVAVESDPVISNKPESTGWLDVDDDDTCSEASFCSAVSHLAVGPGAYKLEQEHITSAHSFDICDDTTLPSSYSILPTGSGRDLECGLYALIERMPHQMSHQTHGIDDLRPIVDSPDYTQFMAVSQESGSSNMSVIDLLAFPKSGANMKAACPLQLAVMMMRIGLPQCPSSHRRFKTAPSKPPISGIGDTARALVTSLEHHNPNVGRGKCFR